MKGRQKAGHEQRPGPLRRPTPRNGRQIMTVRDGVLPLDPEGPADPAGPSGGSVTPAARFVSRPPPLRPAGYEQ